MEVPETGEDAWDPIQCLFSPSLLIGSVDNSEYMRNGDFLPTRLQAQQDAVNIVCHSKTRSNPENNVGLITLAKYVGRGGGLAGGWEFPHVTHYGVQVATLL